MELNIVMVEPEIPQNTGNIVRTCAALGAKLHLVYPLGFDVSDRYLKRAGLDYWDKMDIEFHDSLDSFLEKYPPELNNMFFTSKKAKNVYSEVEFSKMDKIFVLFGKETKGLPEELLQRYFDKSIRIPMREGLRCLNQSNSVAIVAYEIERQNGFKELEKESKYFDK